MACPKCGNETITVVEEKPKVSGAINLVVFGIMLLFGGIYMIGSSIIIALFLIGGGLASICSSGAKNKVIRCSTCGYEKIMPKTN